MQVHVLKIVYSFIIMKKRKNRVVKKNLQIYFRQFSPHYWELNAIFPVVVGYCIHKRRNISITSSSYLPQLSLILQILHYLLYRVNILNHVLFALSVFITVNILFLYPVRMLRMFGLTSQTDLSSNFLNVQEGQLELSSVSLELIWDVYTLVTSR